MIDFRINMIRPSCQQNGLFPCFLQAVQYFFAVGAHIRMIMLELPIRRIHCRLDLLPGKVLAFPQFLE